MIKKIDCKCGQKYIDFDNQIGQCPACSSDPKAALIQQEFLKSFTYLSAEVALKAALLLISQPPKQLTFVEKLKAFVKKG